MILTPLLKLPKNVEDLGKLIVAKGLKKLPKVKKIAQCGHTDHVHLLDVLPLRLCKERYSCQSIRYLFLHQFALNIII